MIRPQKLENAERDLELVTRTPAAPARPDAGLRARLEEARELKPQGLHWWECWQAGRDAALGVVETTGLVKSARLIQPPEGIGCRDCWSRGRDAAIAAIEGT